MPKRRNKAKSKFKMAFLGCEPWEQKELREKFKKHDIIFLPSLETPADYKKIKDREIISCFIYSRFGQKEFELLPELKYITTRSTGFDHIDLQAAKKFKVKVSNVPEYGSNTVAEHTFALILALARKLYQSIERTKRSDFSLDGLRGFDLQGKTIGVVGTGNIGAHVIRIAAGFGMNILAYDVKKNQKLARKYKIKYVSLNKLLGQSDIISLHVPYNKYTHHLINKNNIKFIKKGAILINTARGGVVETKALVKALTSGILAGAGLDVLEEEGFIKEETQLLDKQVSEDMLQTLLQDHILLHMDNVIVTPHNAFNSHEALGRILKTTIENIESFMKGKVINRVV